MLTTAGLIGVAGLTAAGSVGGALLGAALNKRASDYSSKKAYDAQLEVNREQLAFAREQNEITRQREDNAYQRAVADRRAAGLSPLDASAASASNGMNADLSSEGFTRAAELQAQGAQGFGNALSRAGSDFASAVGNFTQLKNAQTQESVGNSVSAYNSSKTEETNINNATLAASNVAKLLELSEQIENLKKRNIIDGAKADKAQEFVQAEIESMASNAANSRAQAALHNQKLKFNAEDAEFFNDLGLPKSTSTSFNATSVGGMAEVTTRNAANMAKNNSQPLNASNPDLLKVARASADSEAKAKYDEAVSYWQSVVDEEKQNMRERNIVKNTERLTTAQQQLKQTKANKKQYYSNAYESYGLTSDGKRFRN